MRKLFLIITFVSINILAQSNLYTLEQCIQLGIQNNKALKISNSQVAIASAKMKEIRSQRFPQLKFNASYMRLSDVPPFQIKTSFFPTPITIQEPILNSYNLQLSLRQPLFTGFKLSSLHNSANLNLESTELDYSKEINEEAFKIISAFWNIYKAENANRIIDENLKSLQAHIKDSKMFLETDLITKNDLLKIEVQYSTLQLRKIEMDNSVEIAKAMLNKTIGNNIDLNIEIKTDKIILTDFDLDFNELLQEAKETRLELESIDKKISAGKELLNASNSGWYPSIYLVSDLYYSRPNQRIFPQRDQFDDTWNVGVALSWDIWNWGYNSSQSEQAEGNLVMIETKKSQLEDAIEIEVYNSFLGLRSAVKKVELSKQTLEQASENYRITNDKFLVQLVNTTELLDAETSLYSAKIDLQNSLVDYELAQNKLNKSVGRKLY